MKYNYQIVSSFDPTDIICESRLTSLVDKSFVGYSTYEEADAEGERELDIRIRRDHRVTRDQYYIKVIPTPENIVEEDEMEGHYYPGHETWKD